MIRKGCALLLIFLQLCGPALASVLTVEEVSVVGAAADDYYSAARPRLKVLTSDKVGLSLVNPAQLSATASLSGLTAGALGIAGIGYYARTGKDPVYAAASVVASAADALFVPAYQAFKANFVSPETFPASAAQYVGVEGAVGATLQNIVDHVKGSAAGAYQSLKNLLDAHSLPVVVNPADFMNGVVLALTDGTYFKITQQPTASGWTTMAYWNNNSSGKPKSTYSDYIYVNGQYINVLDINETRLNDYGVIQYRVYAGRGTVTATDPTYSPEAGLDYAALQQEFAQANLDAAVANDLRNAIAELPAAQKITSSDPAPAQVPAANPQTITNNQIQNFFTENTSNVYSEYLNTVTNQSSTVTNEAAHAAAETAKAQEEEATQETFPSISASAFEEPYNPGEHDIPARFTTFLNNVKSSGLFSFSSDFFDSLPGGGSSTYTIEAGRYGSHTVDLADTMSTGLAVLKTILLACFGFLSIRAVIMKR